MRLSVVIPTFRRRPTLMRTLAALEAQTVGPGTFEVIVVDDPVDDDPEEVARAVAVDRRAVPVRVVHRKARGVSAARNAGWRAAQAPLVLFLGDDIIGHRRLVEEHLAWHDDRGGDAVGVLGQVRWASELRMTPFMHWLDHGIQFNYTGLSGDEATCFDFYTANVSLPRRLLEQSGGFDEERYPFLYEDLDLGYRLGRRGFRLLYNRAALAEHLHPTGIPEWQRRMAATAPAERRWVAQHPELPAYFHDRMSEAMRHPPNRGAGRALMRWLGPSSGRLGRWAWRSADLYYRQQLAPAFLAAWQADEGDAERLTALDRC